MKSIFCALALLLMLSLNAQELTMGITNPQVNGNQITYDVSTGNFTEMVAMQYSITYDPDVLSFVALENLNLLALDAGDFNTNIPGSVLNVWLEPTLQGVSLDDGTVIYQIVFEMLDGEPGVVCFSEDPVVSEFIKKTIELTSFTVVDDCHSEPFQILLTISSLQDIASRYGMSIANPAHSQKISFSLEEDHALEFKLFDLAGRQLLSFARSEYQSGNNALEVGTTLLPGIYVLTTEIQNQPIAVKILYE
jgi:hypothetical protein